MEPLRSGKASSELLARLLAELPPSPPEVRLGPAVGEDACAIQLHDDLLVAAADPVTLTAQELGTLSVVVNANDVAVTGARPRWFLAVILLPPGSTAETVRSLFSAVADAVEAIGAHLVGGHTEVTAAVTRPVVVGQMLGLAEGGRLLTTGGAAPGEVIVQVGPVPLEGAAVLARESADRLDGLDPVLVEAARACLEDPGISVVEPALLAARLGATALHDPTEGGLAVGLQELARASDVRLEIDPAAVLWFEPGCAVCKALGAAPWSTLASGSLLATFPAAVAGKALAALREQGYPAAAIGTTAVGTGVHDLSGHPLRSSGRDEVARVLAVSPEGSTG